MPPCHGGGREFESRPDRSLTYKSISYNKKGQKRGYTF
jgi:hypothetical protein